VAKISGEYVYKHLKYEGGVHKVQRVPETENKGRVHSSTCQVIVLPEAKLVNTVIDERDLKIDCYRASGAGGQHVNTTDSAVRITHLPTGIVVTNQDEREQHRNKAKALENLKKKIKELEFSSFHSTQNENRKKQMGSGNLNEKIRTYNWPDSRVTGIFNNN
jgi:peptide chain release factor 1